MTDLEAPLTDNLSPSVSEARDRLIDDWFNMAPPDVTWDAITARVDNLIAAVRAESRPPSGI